MKRVSIFRRRLAIGRKTSRMAERWGQGANLGVEVHVALTGEAEREPAARAIGDALREIDHRALGVDVDLGYEPSGANLARFLRDRLHAGPPVVRIECRLGDGRSFSWCSPEWA